MEGTTEAIPAAPAAIGGCPRCRCALVEGRSGEQVLFGCGQCGGVWLDSAASKAVLDGAAQGLTALADLAARNAKVAVDRRPDGLPCPKCGQPLSRGLIPNTAIEIDVCAADGTWFDANELHIVALAFAKLPAPMRFDAADYVEYERGVPAKVAVRDLDPDMLFALVVVAVLGALYVATFHVLSLFGYVVSDAREQFLAPACAILPGVLGMFAHWGLGTAAWGRRGLELSSGQLWRGLRGHEKPAYVAAFIYSLVMGFVFLPDKSAIIRHSHTVITDPRALWCLNLAMSVASVAVTLSAYRIAREQAAAKSPGAETNR